MPTIIIFFSQEAELAAIEAAENEKEEVEEKKRREAEGIFDEVETILPLNNNNNKDIPPYADQVMKLILLWI